MSDLDTAETVGPEAKRERREMMRISILLNSHFLKELCGICGSRFEATFCLGCLHDDEGKVVDYVCQTCMTVGANLKDMSKHVPDYLGTIARAVTVYSDWPDPYEVERMERDGEKDIAMGREAQEAKERPCDLCGNSYEYDGTPIGTAVEQTVITQFTICPRCSADRSSLRQRLKDLAMQKHGFGSDV